MSTDQLGPGLETFFFVQDKVNCKYLIFEQYAHNLKYVQNRVNFLNDFLNLDIKMISFIRGSCGFMPFSYFLGGLVGG